MHLELRPSSELQGGKVKFKNSLRNWVLQRQSEDASKYVTGSGDERKDRKQTLHENENVKELIKKKLLQVNDHWREGCENPMLHESENEEQVSFEDNGPEQNADEENSLDVPIEKGFQEEDIEADTRDFEVIHALCR
jgi:hypothetical protein